MMRTAGLSICVASLLACDPVPNDGVAICDPFAVAPQPIELDAILAAGRAADGTLYVVADTDEPLGRVFVSEGGGIRRVDVTNGGGGGGSWLFGVAAHAPPFTLLVTEVGDVFRIGLVVGESDAEFHEISEADEELALVDHDEVLALPVYDLVRTVAFEYTARTSDGRTLAVLVPDPLEDGDHYRLFLGDDELIEHAVLSFRREEDGGTTTIDFDVGTETPAVAHFPTPESPELPDTLTIDGVTEALTATDPSTFDGAVYRCLAR